MSEANCWSTLGEGVRWEMVGSVPPHPTSTSALLRIAVFQYPSPLWGEEGNKLDCLVLERRFLAHFTCAVNSGMKVLPFSPCEPEALLWVKNCTGGANVGVFDIADFVRTCRCSGAIVVIANNSPAPAMLK